MFGTVIAGEDDERILLNPFLFQVLHQPADVVIQHRDTAVIGRPILLLGFANDLRAAVTNRLGRLNRLWILIGLLEFIRG